MAKPLVSLVLCVKDGMPYLPAAVESVRAQTYPKIELIAQDAASTDGTLEYLQSVEGLPRFELVSEPDGGIGDAYNRAHGRCNGEILGSIDADNLLEPTAVETAVRVLQSHADFVAVYGGIRVIDDDGAEQYTWVPEAFDVLRLITCELVPPFSTAFFSRTRAGDALRIDEELATCADYDLWLRLSHLPILRTEHVLGSTRMSEKSMTMQPERYDDFCRDKISALMRFLSGFENSVLIDTVRAHGSAGIWTWAAGSVFRIEGASERARRYQAEAEALDPGSPTLAALRRAMDSVEQAGEAAGLPA